MTFAIVVLGLDDILVLVILGILGLVLAGVLIGEWIRGIWASIKSIFNKGNSEAGNSTAQRLKTVEIEGG